MEDRLPTIIEQIVVFVHFNCFVNCLLLLKYLILRSFEIYFFTYFYIFYIFFSQQFEFSSSILSFRIHEKPRRERDLENKDRDKVRHHL